MARRVGGVDARKVGVITPKVGPAHGDLVYHGGPTISCPRIHATFWGPNWSDRTHQAQAARLVQFLKDLAARGSSQFFQAAVQLRTGRIKVTNSATLCHKVACA
jgi:hypothetical protein